LTITGLQRLDVVNVGDFD